MFFSWATVTNPTTEPEGSKAPDPKLARGRKQAKAQNSQKGHKTHKTPKAKSQTGFVLAMWEGKKSQTLKPPGSLSASPIPAPTLASQELMRDLQLRRAGGFVVGGGVHSRSHTISWSILTLMPLRYSGSSHQSS